MHLAIISCAGNLPKRLRQVCIDQQLEHKVIALKGICDADLSSQADKIFPMGHFASAVDYMKKSGITHIVMAGHLSRPSLLDLSFDFKTLNLLRKNRNVLLGGDDAVLSRISRYFESIDFTVLGPGQVDPTLFAEVGTLVGPAPSKNVVLDIEKGIEIYRMIGPADIGQSFILHNGNVLAVEAREGTDQMIERVANLRDSGRIRGRGKIGILFKYQKPNQDVRLDTPVIGLRTIENAIKARLQTIVISSGNVIIMQKEEILKLCKKESISLIAVDFDNQISNKNLA